MTTEVQFNAAVNVIRSLPKDGPYQPSHDMMLKFYALYKQATQGPCTDPKPMFFEVVKGYKWRAWENLGQMSKEEAMQTYVDELKKIIETMSLSENVENFMSVTGNIYEYVETLGYGEEFLTSHKNNSPRQPRKENVIVDPGPQTGDFISHILSNGKPNGSVKHSSGSNGWLGSLESDPEGLSDYSFLNGDASPELSPYEDLKAEANNLKRPFNYSSAEEPSHSRTVPSIRRKSFSDSDSDEEYSEPAEGPAHLELSLNLEKDVCLDGIPLGHDDGSMQSFPTYISNLSDCSDNTLIQSSSKGPDPMTCGLYGETKQTLDCMGAGASLPSGNVPQSPQMSITRGSSRRSGAGRRRRRSGGSGYSETGQLPGYSGVNVQLIVILQKIHEDLQGVLQRLDALEMQAITSRRTQVCSKCQEAPKGWWPFPELSPKSTFFLLTWPLLLKGAAKFLLFLRSRKRARNISQI